MITFQEEKWEDFVKDAEALFPLHWKELALNQEKFQHAMDHERYHQLDKLGMLLVLTARADQRLIGYAICFLTVHMHYKDAGLFSLADMYYLLPEFRTGGCGAKLLIEMELGLRRRGVTQAHMSCKVHQDHQLLFERMGWSFTDKTFSKYIKAT